MARLCGCQEKEEGEREEKEGIEMVWEILEEHAAERRCVMFIRWSMCCSYLVTEPVNR